VRRKATGAHQVLHGLEIRQIRDRGPDPTMKTKRNVGLTRDFIKAAPCCATGGPSRVFLKGNRLREASALRQRLKRRKKDEKNKGELQDISKYLSRRDATTQAKGWVA